MGVIFVADVSTPSATTHFNDPLFYTKFHLLWSFIGFCFMIFISKLKTDFWRKNSFYIFSFSLFLLFLVLIPGFGNKLLGARRWLSLGPLSFQPSELVKISIILYLANLAHLKRSVIGFFVPLGLVCFLIMAQPDLGTALLIGSIGISIIFMSGIEIKVLMKYLFGVVLIVMMVAMFSSYRRQRIVDFLNVMQHPLNSSYHLQQALFAVSQGGVFGVGFGQSKQKFLFLPEASTDSIFPIISEEIGFVGSVSILLIYAYFVYRMFRISKRSNDVFSKVVSSAIAVWIGSQVILNIGSMIALVPLTGVPLPFLSYGKTSLMSLFLALGIILGISRNAREN